MNIQEDDRGLYQCTATNEAATITAETELLVENVPQRAPHNLTASSTANAVHLKWVAGRRRTHIEYTVWFRPALAEEWKYIKVSSKKVLETVISNLNPGKLLF